MISKKEYGIEPLHLFHVEGFLDTLSPFNGLTATVVLVAWLPDGQLLMVDHGESDPCRKTLVEGTLLFGEDWRDGMARILSSVAKIKLHPNRLELIEILTKNGLTIVCTVRFFSADRDDFEEEGERPSRTSLWPTSLPECALSPLQRTVYDLVVARHRTAYAGGSGYKGH